MLKIAWSPIYVHPLPENHRFPMVKYELLYQQLLREGTAAPENFFKPAALQEEHIVNVHKQTYWQKLKDLNLDKEEIRRTGFPLSSELVEREITIANGTLQAALFALQYGVAMNIAGGTHHAFTDKGEGFCLLNDMAIAAGYLLKKGFCHKILIVDLDVHQGNGTAEIFKNNPAVFTFSIHGEKNYPLHKENSDLDIPLPDKTDDRTYLHLLSRHLGEILERFQPDFIFYQSGVDVLATDKLGRLSLSREGCKERDRLVLRCCRENNIPVAVSMGGGYSEKIAYIIEAHANTFRLAQNIFF